MYYLPSGYYDKNTFKTINYCLKHFVNKNKYLHFNTTQFGNLIQVTHGYGLYYHSKTVLQKFTHPTDIFSNKNKTRNQ